jgi:alpha-tubulin suppressor-like RCC1 family protein
MRSRTPFPSAALGSPTSGSPSLRRLAPLLAPALVVAALGCGEDAQSPTAPEVTAPLATSATAAAPAFQQVSSGGVQTCGVSTENRVYCWGYNVFGMVGDGTTTDRLTPTPVAGTLRFRQVDAGASHTCAVTTDNRAYCWGWNRFGALGDGTTETRLQPVPVAGGHQFRQVDAGEYHTCGRTTDNRVYCWGNHGSGQLGIGTSTGPETCEFNACSTRPIAVVGALVFRQISAGAHHTCGVTTAYRAYCWGGNSFGTLGDSSTVIQRLRPARVAGGHQFRQVEAGLYHTCGVTTGDRAFCWGDGRSGQIGDGKLFLRFWPRRVAGGLSFSRVSTEGFFHTCGETTQNRAYCWGDNSSGQLGDGTTTRRLTPVAVAGGLFFSQVSAGAATCGRTPAAVAYCWGYNGEGAVGDGTTTTRLRPVPVAGGE